MSLRALGFVWFVLAIGLVAAVAIAWAYDFDGMSHDEYSRALRQSQELDARLDEEVAKSRLGIVPSYDRLVSVWDRVMAVEHELRTFPSIVDDAGATVLEERIDQYGRALKEKEALIESFKTEQAVLRNSVRAFTHNSERLRAQLHAGEADDALAQRISALEHDVLLMMIAASEPAERRAVCELIALGSPPRIDTHRDAPCPEGARAIAPERVAEVAPVLGHARIVVERHRAVEDLVSRILTLPVESRANAIREAYIAAVRRADAASQLRWVVVFVLALAVVGVGAAYIIARVHGSAVALRETTSKLETALAQLQIERDKDKEVAELKSRFVAMTSHEFRTPLSVILSSAELVEAYGDRWPKERRDLHLGRVQEAAKGMSKMLDGVLLIGRAEAGMLELNPQPIKLRELCDALVEEQLSIVGSSRVIEYSNDAPDTPVWMDEKLLRHVLTNLLSNAFKYSPDDSVVQFAVKQNGRAVLFDIRDTGIGIPEEDRARLFEAFHRGRNAAGIPGTGLGLAVVRKSLEVHGGSISVESELGVGTRFEVRVPFAEGKA